MWTSNGASATTTACFMSLRQCLCCLSFLVSLTLSRSCCLNLHITVDSHTHVYMAGSSNGKVAKQLQWQQQPQQQQPQQQLPPQHILAGPPPPAAPPALPQGPFSTGAPAGTAAAVAAAAAAAAAAGAPRNVGLQHANSLEGGFPDPPPTLWEFFHAEATPHEKYPTADVLWRQTERDRV